MHSSSSAVVAPSGLFFLKNKVHRKIIANKILYFRKICLTVISRNVLASCCAQLFETCNFSLYAIYELVLDSLEKKSCRQLYKHRVHVRGRSRFVCVICQG